MSPFRSDTVTTLVQIGNLAIPDALIEIEAVAALDG